MYSDGYLATINLICFLPIRPDEQEISVNLIKNCYTFDKLLNRSFFSLQLTKRLDKAHGTIRCNHHT